MTSGSPVSRAALDDVPAASSTSIESTRSRLHRLQADGRVERCHALWPSPPARVLVSAVAALETAVGAELGRTVFGGREVPLSRGHGAAPTGATTGQVEAMALYAGEGVGAVHDLPSAADALRHLCSSVA